VIVVPLKHLLDQWHKEARGFDFNAIKCYENSDVWRAQLAKRLGQLHATYEGYVIAMVTNSTFIGDSFQQVMDDIEIPFLIVADEAHNLGSQANLDALPSNARYRLALSATPDRYNDRAGTEGLSDYFGGIIINYDLEDAIENKYLCPYDYHPHLCPMSELEYEQYLELTNELANERKKHPQVKTKKHESLIGKRNDLITGVESKLEILEARLRKQEQDGGVKHTLIYAGSHKGADELRHIERTVKVIGRGLNISIRKFTYRETAKERIDILKNFASGELQAIVAIKCLDEGVDIPATRVAYILASTKNPKEFIQRRGRVLRLSPGKEKAIIHDFLVAPPHKRYEDDDLLEKEISRAKVFAELALNKSECNATISKFSEQFGIILQNSWESYYE
jgi:superfamily II DNA or RNA helicase